MSALYFMFVYVMMTVCLRTSNNRLSRGLQFLMVGSTFAVDLWYTLLVMPEARVAGGEQWLILTTLAILLAAVVDHDVRNASLIPYLGVGCIIVYSNLYKDYPVILVALVIVEFMHFKGKDLYANNCTKAMICYEHGYDKLGDFFLRNSNLDMDKYSIEQFCKSSDDLRVKIFKQYGDQLSQYLDCPELIKIDNLGYHVIVNGGIAILTVDAFNKFALEQSRKKDVYQHFRERFEVVV